jgi:hypothetical protein
MITTTVTDQIVKLAEQAGLNPYWRGPYKSCNELVLMGSGDRAPMGAVYVGVNSGKVLRASITYGNDGPTRKFTGAREVQAALRELVRETNR